MSEILPCPFCGKDPETWNQRDHKLRVRCVTELCPCAYRGWWTVDEWNDRPGEAALRAKLEASEARVKELGEERDEAMRAGAGAFDVIVRREEQLDTSEKRVSALRELLADAEAFVSLVTHRKPSALPVTQFATQEEATGWITKARAALAFPMQPKPCPENCPADYTGHWRDWHRGHGCEADIRGNGLAPPEPK